MSHLTEIRFSYTGSVLRYPILHHGVLIMFAGIIWLLLCLCSDRAVDLVVVGWNIEILSRPGLSGEFRFPMIRKFLIRKFSRASSSVL